ncbi:Polyketide cyclase / dehydrase and lipid transport [compost metagenome]
MSQTKTLQITTSHEFDAPADVVWTLLEDFAQIERWWPKDEPAVSIQRVELEGEGIGLIRHIYNHGFPAPVSERPDFQDPANLVDRLSIVGQRPAGLLGYQAAGRIERLPGERSQLHYCGEFSTEPEREAEAGAFLRGAYALMSKGLAQTASREASAS